MTTDIKVYYDFRSPYAYFSAHRLRHRQFQPLVPVSWNWRPISIDVLLNLQAGRAALAPYVDPLPAPKRRHLLADVRRCAEMYGASLKPPRPSRPNSQIALGVSLLLRKRGVEDNSFRNAVFAALWENQRDIADPIVLGECLGTTGAASIVAEASSSETRAELISETQRAYEAGVFGVPSFVLGDEVFFGNDRLDMVGWRLQKMPNN
jgi:2-hydroxychromene-2-carboxylate isomerase